MYAMALDYLNKSQLTDLTAKQGQNLNSHAAWAQYQVAPESGYRLRAGEYLEIYVGVTETFTIPAVAGATTATVTPACGYANPAAANGGPGLAFGRRCVWKYVGGSTLNGAEATVTFNADGSITGPADATGGTLTLSTLPRKGEIGIDLLTNAADSVQRKQVPIWHTSVFSANGVFQYAPGAGLKWSETKFVFERMLLSFWANLAAKVDLGSPLTVVNIGHEDAPMSAWVDHAIRVGGAPKNLTKTQLIASYVKQL